MATNFSQTAAYIWSLADLLRGDFKQSQYGRVILPFTIPPPPGVCAGEQRGAPEPDEQYLNSKELQAGFQRVVFDMLLAKGMARPEQSDQKK